MKGYRKAFAGDVRCEECGNGGPPDSKTRGWWRCRYYLLHPSYPSQTVAVGRGMTCKHAKPKEN